MSDEPFPCDRCGAQLEFRPGTDSIACPYCGHQAPIPTGGEVHEQDLDEMLDRLTAAAETQESTVVECASCGAGTTLDPHVVADRCPFCGSAITSAGTPSRQIRPASLLPFRVREQEARQAFRKWLRGLWFAPSALRRRARRPGSVQGVYIPFWTYDCSTMSDYAGLRGDDYWVTVSYTTTVDGRPVTRTRPERRTRWTPVRGSCHDRFDDVLVLASRSLPRKHAERLEPWDLAELVPYRDEYLSGFRAERYQIDLAEGLERAKQRMEPAIRARIRSQIGGDRQLLHSVSTRYDDLTYKHLLLPVWISAYRFRERTFRFLVNARTGEVQGERPWSWVKITLTALAAVAGLVLLGFLVAG